MSMILGDLEELLLLTVQRQSPARVTGIQGHLQDSAGIIVLGGAIDQTLRRLQQKGFVGSLLDGPPPGESGRKVRSFWITEAGIAALARAESVRQAVRK